MGYLLDYLSDFTGGENTAFAPDNVLANQVLVAENVNILPRGGFEKRKGYQVLQSTYPGPVSRIIHFEKIVSGETKSYDLILCTNGKLYLSSNPTAPLYSWGDSFHVDYEVYKGNCYLLGSGNYVVWDGTTFTAVTNSQPDSNLAEVKKCNLVEQRGERFFLTGNPDSPNTVYYSERGDPTYFKTTSKLEIVSDDGDIITAIKEFFDSLMIFKKNSIYAMSGWDFSSDVEINRIPSHVGTHSYRTVQYVGNYLVFLSSEGLYALQGTYKDVIAVRCLSKHHSNEFAELYQPHDTSYTSYTTKIPPWYSPNCAFVFRGRYYLSAVSYYLWLWPNGAPPPSDGWQDPRYPFYPNDRVFVINVDTVDNEFPSIVTYTGWSISDFGTAKTADTFLASLGRDINVATGSVSEFLFGYHDGPLENQGGQYHVRVKTATMSQKRPVNIKKYRYAFLWLRQYDPSVDGSDIHVKAYVDYNEVDQTVEDIVDPNETGVWDDDEATYDSSVFDFSDLVTRPMKIRRRGRRIMFEITDTTTNQPLTVYGIGVEYRVKKPKRG